MFKIKELEDKINKARSDYYNGAASISDKLYDSLIDELSKLDPKNLAIIGIGSEPVSNWEKYTHLVPMGSLNKCNTNDEFRSWANKYVSRHDKFFLTLKLDGLSVSLIYENGILVKAATRGSGVTGELITQNVAKMHGVPLRLSSPLNITVRGEILLSKENHKKYFPDYSNCRNAASGISRRYDGEGSDKLSVLVYHMVSDNEIADTQSKRFEYLKKLGFSVPDYYIIDTADQLIELKDQYQNKLRGEFGFDLDGLVIHNNDLSKIESYGVLNGNPYASLAFKFENESKESKITDIIWQAGSMGRITPVAIIEPVQLVGAMVSRASVYNISNINDLGIDVGATVSVARGNDVIPLIEEVITGTGTVAKAPKSCPSCNGRVMMQGEYLMCLSSSNCPAQISGRIRNWIKELNIMEWGETLIENLVESGKVLSVDDLYKLSVDDLSKMSRMGNKSATKCYNTLRDNMEISLDVFLGALSISMIGGSTIRSIMSAGYDNLEKILSLDSNQLAKISGIGPVKAKSLELGLKDNKDLIDRILSAGITIKAKQEGNLSGKSICFTGSMVNKRPVLEKMAAGAGATVKSSVGKDLSILVIADVNSTSSKAVSARKFGTKLISEEDFIKMANG